MTDNVVIEYCKQLRQTGIGNEVVEHPETSQIAEVLNYLHFEFSDCVPTLIMKSDGRYLTVVRRGDTKADSKKIKHVLHINDVRFATPNEFIEHTAFPLGAACIYTPDTESLIDKKMLEKDHLWSCSRFKG